MVMGIPNGKALGLDGFMIDLYKSWWPIINFEVYALVGESQIQKSILKAFNSTFLNLIPKGISMDSQYKFRS